MGSGISLTKQQVVQVIKRDLLIEHNKIIFNRKQAFNATDIYFNCLTDAKFLVINKQLDKATYNGFLSN
jgi:hypothetical protein